MSRIRYVQGNCPACGHGVLVLGDGGYVTCSLIDCPDPTAVSDQLERNRKVSTPTPSVGRIVHYVSYGTPGGEYGKECRAAILTDVPSDDACSMAVFNPTGLYFNKVPYDGGQDPAGGTWHWPERT